MGHRPRGGSLLTAMLAVSLICMSTGAAGETYYVPETGAGTNDGRTPT